MATAHTAIENGAGARFVFASAADHCSPLVAIMCSSCRNVKAVNEFPARFVTRGAGDLSGELTPPVFCGSQRSYVAARGV